METGIILADKEKKSEIVTAFSTSPTKYCKNISDNISTIRQVFDAYPMQLSEWVVFFDNELKAVLIKFIEGMIRFFGFPPTEMSNEQIVMTVNGILEKYYYFRLEDICMCFKKARTDSKYKGFFKRLDGSVIMSWFAMYDKERDEVIYTLTADHVAPSYNGDECSREEYEEILLAKIAGGDLYANESLQKMQIVKRLFEADRGEYNNYRYWQKHRFDKRK